MGYFYYILFSYTLWEKYFWSDRLRQLIRDSAIYDQTKKIYTKNSIGLWGLGLNHPKPCIKTPFFNFKNQLFSHLWSDRQKNFHLCQKWSCLETRVTKMYIQTHCFSQEGSRCGKRDYVHPLLIRVYVYTPTCIKAHLNVHIIILTRAW